MGSVGSVIQCPNCKGPAHEEFYYKSGEVYIMCDLCGYYEAHELDRDKMEKDNIKDLRLLTEDYWTHVVQKPIACINERFEKFGRMCVVETGTVDEAIDKLKKNKDNIGPDKEWKSITLNWYSDNKHYSFDVETDKITEVNVEEYTEEASKTD